MGTVFRVLLRRDRCDCAGDMVQTFGADGDPDGDFVPGAVKADLELEGVVQAALEVLGQPGEKERELRQRCQQARVGRAGFGPVVGELGELGELGGLGAVLRDQLGEPALDGLPVFAGGIGIVPALLSAAGWVSSSATRARLRRSISLISLRSSLARSAADEIVGLDTAAARLGVHGNRYNDLHMNLAGR